MGITVIPLDGCPNVTAKLNVLAAGAPQDGSWIPTGSDGLHQQRPDTGMRARADLVQMTN
jgi:hypothetical protein